MKNLLFCALLALSPAGALAADAAVEFEMFSDTQFNVPAATAAPAAEEQKSVGFSGEVMSVLENVVTSTSSADPFNSYIVGNIMLDARLKHGVKAFANMETSYVSRTRETSSTLREAFLDFNINRDVYFRTGKQVLQWGRCSLWNPTDLVNVEKKPFIRKIGSRDGAYGVKFHVPFGTTYNIYGFLDTGSAGESRDLGGALKFELLAGKTEMAFSGWGKRNRYPVFGYDVSSRLGDVDISGELSAARRDNTRYVRERGGVLDTYLKDDKWVTRAAVNFSEGFRLGNFNDRLTVAAGVFYNQNGYDGAPFRDKTAYTYTGPLALLSAAGTKKNYLIGNGLYEPNYLSKYYGAVFTSVGRFLITDMTLNMNYVRNLSDDSGVLSAGVNYKNMNDLSAGFLASAYLGPRYREYTASGAKLLLQLTAGVSF